MSEEKSSGAAMHDLFKAWLVARLGSVAGRDLINYEFVEIALPYLDTGKSISGEITPEHDALDQIGKIQELVSVYGNESRKQFSITLNGIHMTITRMG